MKSITYDFAAIPGAPSCAATLFDAFAAVIVWSGGVMGASETHAATPIAPAIVAVRMMNFRIVALLRRSGSGGAWDSSTCR